MSAQRLRDGLLFYGRIEWELGGNWIVETISGKVETIIEEVETILAIVETISSKVETIVNLESYILNMDALINSSASLTIGKS